MGSVEPYPYGFGLLEEIVKDFGAALHRLQGCLEDFGRRVAMDGLVIKMEAFGESFEWNAHVNRDPLGVNPPARLIVQLGQDYLEAAGTAKDHLKLRLHGGDLNLQISCLTQDFGSGIRQRSWYGKNLHKIHILSTINRFPASADRRCGIPDVMDGQIFLSRICPVGTGGAGTGLCLKLSVRQRAPQKRTVVDVYGVGSSGN